MNWEAIGAVGELAGSSAVLIILIYLAVQIRRKHEFDSRREHQIPRPEGPDPEPLSNG